MSDVNKIIEDSVKNEIDKIDKQKISRHEFYFETALYEPVFCDDPDLNLFDGVVDAYNSIDGFDTTYDIRTDVVSTYGGNWTGFKRIVLTCKRGGGTALRFFVVIFNDGSIMKIGQYPSLADIQFAEIGKRYNSYLSEIDLRNYKKAIGLYAHGAGAGSFVYLRRIFENLVFETYNKHKENLTMDEADFKSKRMEEKIIALKNYLPSQLFDMKSLYGILSKGVHELSEEECLSYFSPIKLSIVLILDQKIEQSIKEYRDKIVKKELDEIHQKIKNGINNKN